MSLGRLLATGKSLVGVHDAESRYRVNKGMALPKFISPRNPFVSAGKSETPPAQPASPAKVRGTKIAGDTAKTDADAALKKNLRVSMSAQATHWLGEWSRRLTPLPRLVRRPGPVRLARPDFAKPTLQPELSLDAVQVVRNDLSDADFEVVPAKTAGTSVNTVPVSPPDARFELAGRTWDRLTTRIFGAGQT